MRFSCRTINPNAPKFQTPHNLSSLSHFKGALNTVHFGLFVALSLASLFLLSLSIFFSSLVSLWILGTEHSWVLTLAKGDPLRRRSMLAHRTICLHCNIPPQTPIKPLDWMKVIMTCMVALSQRLCHSGHSLKNWSSNQKAVQCMRVCDWPMQCLFRWPPYHGALCSSLHPHFDLVLTHWENLGLTSRTVHCHNRERLTWNTLTFISLFHRWGW